jgi:hypothetical protein
MSDNLMQMQHSTKGAASFSHGGESFESDEDGIISIPSHFVGHAKAHGFSTDIAEKKPVKALAKIDDPKELKKSEKPAKKEDAEDAKAGAGK